MARERDCGRNGRERECVRSREKIAKEIDRKRRRERGERDRVQRLRTSRIVELRREGERTGARRRKEKIRKRAGGRECEGEA